MQAVSVLVDVTVKFGSSSAKEEVRVAHDDAYETCQVGIVCTTSDGLIAPPTLNS